MTVSFETDGIPTSCHVLIVENNGNLLRQIKVRQSRGYSAEHMLKKACQVIENQAKEILDGPKKNENQFGEQYAYKTIQEYENIVGYQINDAFRMGWDMARMKNKNFGIFEEEK
jgi:hypothetical protein